MGIGAFAERAALPSAILATPPNTLGFEQGSALPVCGLAARLLLEAVAVKDGDLVLVTGAAGIVGGFASELARSRGAHVVAAVRQDDGDEARQLGAQTIVNTGPDLGRGVRGTWQHGVDACLDTVGLGAAALACVRGGGAFVTTVPWAIPDPARGISPTGVQVQPMLVLPANWRIAPPQVS
jgi:NADPH:quinone reductase-like Zn-dependent oxidoreductase